MADPAEGWRKAKVYADGYRVKSGLGLGSCLGLKSYHSSKTILSFMISSACEPTSHTSPNSNLNSSTGCQLLNNIYTYPDMVFGRAEGELNLLEGDFLQQVRLV